MPLILFSFSVNTDTQEAAFSGNIEPQVALQLLQNIAISDAVQKANQKLEEEVKENKGA